MSAQLGRHSIFLSYSSTHRDLARELVDALQSQYGTHAVWWDRALESWGDYEIQIRNALNAARVVVVLWSRAAAESDWVKSEAGRANRDHKLVNVRPPGFSWREVPSPYDQHHVSDLTDTAGVLRSIDAVWTGRSGRTPVPLHELYHRQHGRRLLDAKQRTLPNDPRDASPIELLQAAFEVVEYQDVTPLQAHLFDWCTSNQRTSAAQLIHGPGGAGKTRLMIRLAARLRNLGWTTGFLERPHEASAAILKQRQQAIEQLLHHGEGVGVLVVVDYAEARQEEMTMLAGLVSQRTQGDSRPVRLVLLARSAGEWWAHLHDESPDLQRLFRGSGGDRGVTELPLLLHREERRALFDASVAAFGPLLEAQGFTRPDGLPSTDHLAHIETGIGYSRPLAVQMAALVWLASAGSASGAADVEELLRLVLGLERDHWRKMLGDLDEECVRDLKRGVAQIAAVQGTPNMESVERLLMADGFYQGRRTARVDVDRIRRSLTRLYGTADGGISPLEPDLIAEHHLATVGDADLIEGCVRWIENGPSEARDWHRRDLLTVLQRATRPEHGVHASNRALTMLNHLVGEHAAALSGALVAVMTEMPGRLMEVMRRKIADLDTEALRDIDDKLPDRSVLLLDLALTIAARRVEVARRTLAQVSDAETERAQLAQWGLAEQLTNLAARLHGVGRGEQALTAIEEAVAIQRQLADARADALPDVATTLRVAGVLLSDLGRYTEALAIEEEALLIEKRFADVDPDTFLPRIANSLNNLSGSLGRAGRHEEALTMSREAVALCQRLTNGRPNAFLPELAACLHSLGRDLSILEHHEAALAAVEEATRIHRRLAVAQPDAHLPDLASSLEKTRAILSDLHRHADALPTSQEAVAIGRRLVEARPDVFLPSLASHLTGLTFSLTNVGRHDEALAASEEAVAIYRPLAAARPDMFSRDLTLGILAVSHALVALGRTRDAAHAEQDALRILEPLLQREPQLFTGLAGVLARDALIHFQAVSEKPDLELFERIASLLGYRLDGEAEPN